MPIFYTHNIDQYTRLAVWYITEPEDFFLEKVPVSRQITHPHKRLQHLAGRYLLQFLYPEFPLPLIQIAHTRKPYLPEESHHFSISHCGQYAAAIVSTRLRVGIDIEEPTERMLKVMPKFLSAAERIWVPADALLHQQVLLGTVFWSVKEAMYKWYSHGDIDFQKHLVIRDYRLIQPEAGLVTGSFEKFEPQQLELPFKIWPGLVLSWVAQ
ncbi:MAG TPA: 4'-phosphopantetheinyl transferase superfamily protein [Phnomibacter sp.]|nr:4'-phosphopantetheinyl transferase superfamily protein [Phnomibacter sp.]